MTGAEFSFEPLTPTAFLYRAARVYGDKIGVVDGSVRFTYVQFLQRALRFAGALKALGIAPGDRVAVLAGNSSVEIEQALATHAAVLEAAVVAAPDEKWGEVPVAFVELRRDTQATAAELTDHVRKQLARFKAPKRIIFGPLPKTATGKVQKNLLREQLKQPT